MNVEYLDLADFIANHPLPDGNKRAAWVSLRMFIAINDWSWARRPDLDDAEEFVLSIAAGKLDDHGVADLLRAYLVAPEPQ